MQYKITAVDDRMRRARVTWRGLTISWRIWSRPNAWLEAERRIGSGK